MEDTVIHKSFEILKNLASTSDIITIRSLYRKWCKENPGYKEWDDAYLYNSIINYISTLRPLESDISLNDCAAKYCLNNIEMLPKRFAADGIQVKEMLDGFYLSAEDEAKVRDICINYLPLSDLFFSEFPTGTQIDYTSFSNRKTEKDLNLLRVRFRDSDSCYHLYFSKTNETTVISSIQKWLSINLPDYVTIPKGCASVQAAASELSVAPDTLYDWALKKPECAKRSEHFLFIRKSALSKAHAHILESIDIELVVRQFRKLYTNLTYESANSMITDALPAGCPAIYAGSRYLGLNPSKYYYAPESEVAVKSFVRTVFDQAEIIPLMQLSAITGYRTTDLIEKVNQNVISAKFKDNAYFVSMAELNRITDIAKQHVGIDVVATHAIQHTESLFDYKKSSMRSALYAYIADNDWWCIEHKEATQVPEINAKKNDYFIRRKDMSLLARHIKLWLTGFRRSNSAKCKLLISHYQTLYPKTCNSLLKYFSFENKTGVTLDDASTKNTLDYLFSILPGELSDMNEEEIKENIIIPFSEDTSLQAKCNIATFLFDCNIIKRKYTFESAGCKLDTAAYSVQSFSIMVYTVINQDSWVSHSLIAKAVDNKTYADMWLFIALHFLAAWRTTDLIRLPNPQLYYPPEEVLERIKAGTYPSEDAIAVSQSLMNQLRSLSLTPNKTTSSSNSYIPVLQIFIPTNLEKAFGIILSIAAAHFELDDTADQFVMKRNRINDIRGFLGEEFAHACENRSFSTRRANKALMQAVECAAGNGNGPRPYLFAAFMRSHKGGYANLPTATEIYLRDANFSGYKPEYIVYQMFERGICSFYADALLKYSFGDEYEALPVSSQTVLIQTIGLSCYGIKQVVDIVRKAQEESIKTVQSILQSGPHNSTEMLKSILSGDAIGKSSEALCLIRAAGEKCKVPERLGCLGCRYEIKTKALLSFYYSEYLQLQSDCKKTEIAASALESMRRKSVMEKELIPAMYEICSHLAQHTDDIELSEYQFLIQGVLDNGDSNAS